MKPPNENGGPVSRTAACVKPPTAKPKADDFAGGVKAGQMAAWLDAAIAMCRKAATDPVEFQRLGIWLQRMRRAIG